MTKLKLLPLLLLISPAVVTAGPSSLRFLSEQNPHQACSVEDLAEYCPDDSVDHTKLVAECEGTHGIPAAKCYYHYLCENHDQDAVNRHKTCIDKECPLAKRMPALNCETYLATLEGGAEEGETTPTSDANEETTPEEGTENTEEENTEEEETKEEETTEEEPAHELDDHTPAYHTPVETTKEEAPEPEELIEEEVEVSKPNKLAQENDEDSDSDGSSSGPGLHTATKVFLWLGIPICCIVIAFILRDRLYGRKEAYPFDTHIQANPSVSVTNSIT